MQLMSDIVGNFRERKNMIKVGISSCLLGNKVRFDGGHRNNRLCNDKLSEFFSFECFCPEVGIGLPVPRNTIRLEGNVSNPKAILRDKSQTDITSRLQEYSVQQKQNLSKLSGFIFCKASPSCGTNRVRVYGEGGQAVKEGIGIFAAQVQKFAPALPIEDDGRLHDPLIRDSFIKRVYIYSEWREINNAGLTLKKLHDFHAKHKFTLLSHCQPTLRILGKRLAQITKSNLKDHSENYIQTLMSGLTKVATRKNNTNALLHIQGFLKRSISAEDKAELTRCIHDYLKGAESLLTPIRLLKHHLSHHPNSYALKQSFLNPYPKQLGIRVKTM